MANDSQPLTVLITGGLSDIGRAAAAAFARAGYAVAVNYRSHAEKAAAFAESLVREHGAPAAAALQADIRARPEVRLLFEQVYDRLGRCDVLINNAGINIDRPFLEMTDEDWEIVTETILGGAFRCSQEFARRYAGDAGCILNIGATTAIRGRKNGANYVSARAGVLALTKCMALELAPRIRVNTVTPGWIETEEVRTRYHLEDAQNYARAEQSIPLGRLGRPEELADMLVYVAQSGSYITGQNFLVDGGYFMH